MKRVCLALVLASAAAANAEVGPTCEQPREIDKYQLLRRLSLDLRGKAPSVDEYAALDAQSAVPAQTIKDWLATDEFRLSARRYHEAMFWPNVSNVQLHGAAPVLAQGLSQVADGGLAPDPAWRYALATRSERLRGLSNVNCGDFEQTHFDPAFPGQFRPDPAFIQTAVINGTTVKQEGWRYVTPYWDPTTQIKVCAFEAQETPSVKINTVDVPCGVPQGNGNVACGCGPSLKWCYTRAADRAILFSLREQLDLAVDATSRGGAPYTDLILSTKTLENGPIAFWKKNLAQQVATNQTWNTPDPGQTLLDKGFTDATWTEVDRKELHAGVITTPAYLLRFQTNRGRANRWRIDFLCEHFVPPAVMQPQAGCSDSSADLTQRCNCQYCHSKLEPLAAHFGKFTEAGSTLMTDPVLFPLRRTTCVSNNPSNFCARFYVTTPGAPNEGSLLAYQFTPEHPEYLANIEGGPRALAQKAIDDGTFARCTAKNVFRYYVKRDLRAEGTDSDELPLLDSLAKGFKDNGFSYPWLVEQVVSLPQYRGVR
jgi:hypothetical protein